MADPSRSKRPRRKEHPHRINDRIRAAKLRLIDEEGEQMGVVERGRAIEIAQERGFDLVEIAERADPPVCRLLNYSKFLYEHERKAKQARKHRQRPPHQIRMRPSIADNDYQTKRAQIEKFIAKGDKVRVSVVFKGRQNTHPELGEELLLRLAEDLKGVALMEAAPRREGTNMHIMLGPVAQKPAA